MTDAATGATAQRLRVDGTPPWFANMAEVMDPAPELLDRLVNEFAPIGVPLEADRAWWIGFHLWMVDKFAGEVLAGHSSTPVREALWAICASGYWCNIELQRAYGIPDALINLGFNATVPTEESYANLVAQLGRRYAALEAGGDALLAYVPDLLQEAPSTGALHGTAYNGGVMALWSGTAPLGQRPAHLHVGLGGPVRMNPRDFLMIDYPIAVPEWLDRWRARYEANVRAHPDEFEQVVSGDDGGVDLRDMWSEALAWGINNWGSGVTSLDEWTQGYFDAQVYWGMVLNFGLEAVSMASISSLLERDAEAARQAVTANALQLGAWGVAVLSLIDPVGQLPELVPA
jgi:hypothetical protein